MEYFLPCGGQNCHWDVGHVLHVTFVWHRDRHSWGLDMLHIMGCAIPCTMQLQRARWYLFNMLPKCPFRLAIYPPVRSLDLNLTDEGNAANLVCSASHWICIFCSTCLLSPNTYFMWNMFNQEIPGKYK
jgi:hypothetical protein